MAPFNFGQPSAAQVAYGQIDGIVRRVQWEMNIPEAVIEHFLAYARGMLLLP